MKPRAKQRLRALLALAGFAAQSLPGSSFLASALALGIHPHAHLASLVADRGHVDFVLAHSHDDDAGVGTGHGEGEPPIASSSRTDHVFHVTGDDPASTTSRRCAPPAAPALALAHATPLSRAPARVPQPLRGARPPDCDRLSSVVLRL